MTRKLPISLILLVLLLLTRLSLVSAQGSNPDIPEPPPQGVYVQDQLHWLNASQEDEINAVVSTLDTEGRAEIAVVTIDNCGDDKEKFRNDLFRDWGIGHSDDNDGLLIMVCWYGGDKNLRSLQQETGYGMEGTIPDLMTRKVAERHFIPIFQQDKSDIEIIASGEAGAGLVAMVREYDQVIRGQTPAELQQEQNPLDPVTILIILLVLLLLLMLLAIFSDGTSSAGGYTPTGGYGGDSSSDGGSSFGGGSSGGGGSGSGF